MTWAEEGRRGKFLVGDTAPFWSPCRAATAYNADKSQLSIEYPIACPELADSILYWNRYCS